MVTVSSVAQAYWCINVPARRGLELSRYLVSRGGSTSKGPWNWVNGGIAMATRPNFFFVTIGIDATT
jgi:hypothetical protein